jgi:glycosyltransferase involved in cell wall biosynthesis
MGIPVYTPENIELEALIEIVRPSLGLFDSWQSAEDRLPTVRELSPGIRTFVSMSDLQLLQAARDKRAETPAGSSLQRSEFGSEVTRELNVYASLDAVFAGSSEECAIINEQLGTRTALFVPDAIDEIGVLPLKDRRGIALVGDFYRAPDAGAAEFFCKEVVPRLDTRLLRADPVHVVGKVAGSILGGSAFAEGVKMVGPVPSISPYLARSRVVVAPFIVDGVARTEVLSSMLAGTPVVASGAAVNRIDQAISEHVLIAHDPDEFATRIAGLIEDEHHWQRVAQSGRQPVEERHSEAVASRHFSDAVRTTLGRTPRASALTPSRSTRSSEAARRAQEELILPRIRLTLDQLAPDGTTVAVVSDGSPQLLELGRHNALHFPSNDRGYYSGPPGSTEEVIELLEALRAAGVAFLAVPPTSLWWFEHYAGFEDYLDRSYRRLCGDQSAGAIYALTADRRAIEDDVRRIQTSGLFDEHFYITTYGEARLLSNRSLDDFCEGGYSAGRQPNAYFDVDWYIRRHPEVAAFGTNPLIHYLDARGSRPHPLFDPGFYVATYLPGASHVEALADYLNHMQAHEWRNPVGLFDVDYYLAANPDVADAGVDPVLHYMATGHREGRNPSTDFFTSYYRARYLRGNLEVNPLAHYYDVPPEYRGPTRPGPHDAEEDVHEQIRYYTAPSVEREDHDRTIAEGQPRQAKVIAFYLPQFHSIPENDRWWGRGFTEWRNVMRGTPRFAGHYQPRTPRDLGFYDLTDGETLRKQIDLARASAVFGFAFYYYWFDGRRLLDRPLEAFLADQSLEFPFCVTWANENWTRRWDGADDDVLMEQTYDPDLDATFIDDLQRYFRDERYIRVGGRPLLVVYRLDIIPAAAETITRWRGLWRTRHDEEPLILQAQVFGSEDPRSNGADGAIEFPPHKLVQGMEPINTSLRMFDPQFSGHVFDYESVVEAALAQQPPDYPLVRTAVPSWDNDARRQGNGLVLTGSTPRLYESWLGELCKRAATDPVFGERLVFVNAWNEWAEAAYLEPDVHYGSAYLNATARAVCTPRAESKRRKILLVGHDAHQHGAQHILWHIGDHLRNQFGCEVSCLLLGGGALVTKFERLGRVRVTSDAEEIRAFLEALQEEGYRSALTNTAVTGSVVPLLKDAEFRVVSLIHELPGVVASHELGSELEAIATQSDEVVVPARVVADALGLAGRRDVVVRPQGVYNIFGLTRPEKRARLRRSLGFPDDATVVLNVGFADHRKGADIFLKAAAQAAREGEDLHFVWVGNVHQDFSLEFTSEALTNVHIFPYDDDVAKFYAAADVFFLSSREDPFPSVVLEALQAGLPVVAFRGSGGSEELASEHGSIVEMGDTAAAIAAIRWSSADDTSAARTGRQRIIREKFRYDEYSFDLLRLLEPDLRKISVVVPNFNYAHFLRSRLNSVFNQTHPIFEVIVLDDASTDASLELIEGIVAESGRRMKVVPSRSNSGSVFRQWAKGCHRARGDFVWIAEADDLVEPEFLERLAPQLNDSVAYGFSDSTLIDGDGHVIDESYRFYYRLAGAALMESDFVVPGETFILECLAERNLVLNVSAVVWNRTRLRKALRAGLRDLLTYKLTGDWHLYVTTALSDGQVAYVAQPLNIHRRHDSSVTSSLGKRRHIEEVRRIHELVAQALPVDETLRDRMTTYEDELKRQFGLADATAEPRRAIQGRRGRSTTSVTH